MDYYSVPRRILRGARQLVYPRRCPFCDRVLGSVPICPDCAAELEELPGVCNRILVLRGGRITEELTTEKIDSMTTNDLYTLCMGGHSSEREN